MSETTLRSMVVEPPYAAARRNTAEAPAIGSILLIDCFDVRPVSAQLKPIVDAAPWCPVCVLATEPWEVRHIRRTSRVAVTFSLGEPDGGTHGILSAVASRPHPTPEDVAEWVVRRTRLPSLRRTLSDLFTRPLMARAEAGRIPWAVREQLSLLGEWDACDWQQMWHVAEHAARRNEPIAMDGRAAALFGFSGAELLRLAGWEWVPESALRRSGFFSRERMAARRELSWMPVLDSHAIRSLSVAAWRSQDAKKSETPQFARAG